MKTYCFGISRYPIFGKILFRFISLPFKCTKRFSTIQSIGDDIYKLPEILVIFRNGGADRCENSREGWLENIMEISRYLTVDTDC